MDNLIAFSKTLRWKIVENAQVTQIFVYNVTYLTKKPNLSNDEHVCLIFFLENLIKSSEGKKLDSVWVE